MYLNYAIVNFEFEPGAFNAERSLCSFCFLY